jgi:Protein of unknown function (DUF3619)
VTQMDPNTEFEKHSKAVFDDSLDNLPGGIRSRLTQARHQALAEAKRGVSRRLWIPAAALAGAAAIAALIVVPQMKRPQGVTDSFASDDIVLLLNGEDLALLEDIEFYAWLDSDATTPDTSTENSDVRS